MKIFKNMSTYIYIMVIVEKVAYLFLHDVSIQSLLLHHILMILEALL